MLGVEKAPIAYSEGGRGHHVRIGEATDMGVEDFVAIEGHDPVIRSDGTPERDYIYLSDAVEAYIRLAESLPETSGQAFNFGTNRPESVLGLVERVLELVGCPGLRPRLLGSADNEIDRQRLSSEKARRVLGWQPQVPLAEGLATTVAWYQRYLAAEPAREALSV